MTRGIAQSQAAGRRAGFGNGSAALPTGLAIVLTLLMVPFWGRLALPLPVAIPLTCLIGLASVQLFSFVTQASTTDVFIPTTLVTVYFLTYFAMRCFALVTIPFFGRLGNLSYDDYLPEALWCAILAYALFLLGARSGLAERCLRHLPKMRITWPQSIPLIAILGLALAGLADQVYMFKIGMVVGNFGNSKFQQHPPPGIVIIMTHAVDVVWVILCIFVLRPGKSKNRIAAVCLMPLCLATIAMRLGMTGGKVALIQPALEFALVYHYARRRLRIWELAAAGIPIILLAFGLMNFYRFVVVGQHGAPKSVSDLMARLSTTGDLLARHQEPAAHTPALEQMAIRDAGIDALALVLKYTPNPFPYGYGKDWAEMPLTFIPRQIWKNKPILLPSAEFESTYMAEPSNFNGFSSVHMVSDLYRNFSLPGVIAGMFLIGVAMRLFYCFCAPSPANLPGVFFYAAIFPELVHSFEGDFGNSLVGVLRIIIFTAVTGYIMGIRYRRAAAPRPAAFAYTPALREPVLQLEELS